MSKLEKVSVHIFTHYDAAAALDAGVIKSLSRSMESFLRIGGNLQSKVILQKDGEKLYVPKTKQILVKQNGEAYNGSYTRANGGYITTNGKGAQRLTEAAALEKQISADYLVEKNARFPINDHEEKRNVMRKDKINMA